jgi:hypothetical protein
VATSGADLWDDSILVPLNVTEWGAVIANNPLLGLSAWTSNLGVPDPVFGFPTSIFGRITATSDSWFHEDSDGQTLPKRIYGFSAELVVPGGTAPVDPTAVPEPGSATLFFSGTLAAWWMGFRRRRQ